MVSAIIKQNNMEVIILWLPWPNNPAKAWQFLQGPLHRKQICNDAVIAASTAQHSTACQCLPVPGKQEQVLTTLSYIVAEIVALRP
jgi:hypothetical protein